GFRCRGQGAERALPRALSSPSEERRSMTRLPNLARTALAATLALTLDAAAAAAKDTIVIGIPGTPQGIDLDRQAGPQSWTMAAQVIELGAEWQPIAYPYKPVTGADPTKIPGFTYPNFSQQVATPGIIEKCDLAADGRSATYHLRK